MPSQTDIMDEDLMTGRPQTTTSTQRIFMKEEEKRIKFCPKCGSSNINFLVYYRPSTWECLNCGYQGAFIVEDNKLAEKIREKSLKKIKKE